LGQSVPCAQELAAWGIACMGIATWSLTFSELGRRRTSWRAPTRSQLASPPPVHRFDPHSLTNHRAALAMLPRQLLPQNLGGLLLPASAA
jgi:hypothetical protein